MPFWLCFEHQRHLPISVILILMNLMFQAFIATGFNLILTFDPTPAFNPAHRQCDYEKEPGKVREQQIHSTIKRLKFLAIPATCYLVHTYMRLSFQTI